jgi:hypothetical protein
MGSSFRFLAIAGEEGMLRRVLVDSPRIRFWGTLAAAIFENCSFGCRIYR